MTIKDKPLRLALIGCGFFAQNHLHAWQEIEEVELVAVCDIDPERVQYAADTFHARPYADAAELLAKETVDFVDIATTAPSHRYLVELAASHNLPAICQKPLAWDLPDAEAIVQTMSQRQLPFMVHENFRWQYPMREIKRLLVEDTIGKPFFGRISFRTAHDVYAAQPWLIDNPRMIIVDVAVHLFDLARFFIGEPQALFADKLRVNPIIRGEDVATILLKINEATCIVDVSYETKSDDNTYPQTFVTLEGPTGTLHLGPDYRLQVVNRAGVENRDLVIPEHPWASLPWNAIQDSVYNIQRHWVDCLHTGRTPETSGEDTLRVMDLTLGAYESAETGQVYQVGVRK